MPYFKRVPYAKTRTTPAGTAAPAAGDVMEIARGVLASATGAAPETTLRLRRVLRPGMQGSIRADLALDGEGPPRAIRLAASDLVGPASCIPAERIRIEPAMLVLQPGRAAEIEITIAAPDGARPGTHAGLLTASGEEAFTCRIEAEIG